jgi:hypothetical protein
MAVVVAEVEGKLMNRVTGGRLVETKRRYLTLMLELKVGVQKKGGVEFFGLLGLGINKQWFTLL